jgi:ketosteroid isomerase-like protein
MSQNVDVIRRAYEAGDRETFLDIFAEDVVWDVSRSPYPDGGIYLGPEGVREWFRDVADAFENMANEVEEITDLGHDRVLVVTRARGRGRFSKIGVDYRFAPLFTFRNGKVVRMDRYNSRSESTRSLRAGRVGDVTGEFMPPLAAPTTDEMGEVTAYF